MSWIELSFEVLAEQAMHFSDKLETLGALSVSFYGASDTPILEPKPNTIPLWEKVKLVALFESDAAIKKVVAALKKELPDLEYQEQVLADQNWTLAWQEHFKPAKYGERLWIVPDQVELTSEEHDVIVKLSPGLAFGTGNHASTALCLRWLDQASIQNQTVIDYGCGSGILSLAACKLGAQHVYAIDYDEQAIMATRSNAALNDLAQDQLSAYLPAQVPATLQADIVMANILAPILIELAPTLIANTKIGGTLILAGLLTQQTDEVIKAFRPHFDLQEFSREEDWIILSGTHKPV
jgi:ribosomal protein L11 methyltransferase